MARLIEFGVVGSGQEILQPKYKNRWEVVFRFNGGGGTTQALTYQAITVDRPKLEFEEIVLDRYNTKAYLAGKHAWQPINITFEDDLGGDVSKILQDQLERQQHIIGPNRSATLGAAPSGSRYKFGMEINNLDGDYSRRQIVEKWSIEGAFLQNIDYTDLDYAASETVKITCAIRFDHAHQDLRHTYRGEKAIGGFTP